MSLRPAMVHTTLRSRHLLNTLREPHHPHCNDPERTPHEDPHPSPARLYLAGLSLALAGAFAAGVQAAPGGPGMMGHGTMMAQGPMGELLADPAVTARTCSTA